MLGMATEKLQVKLELNHKAAYREKPTPEGFTHDWMVTIRGPNGSEIEHFVEKVIFYLHDSFKKPKRSVKFPPYQIAESGYAGFTLPIDVCFRNKDEPKKITFYYDLFLHASGCPPVNNTRCEKLTFENPTPEFREKLLKAGAYVLDENHKSPSTEAPSSPTKPSPVATPETKRKEKEISSAPKFPDLKKSSTVKLEKSEHQHHSKSSSDSKKSSHSSSKEKKKSLPSNSEGKKPEVKKSPKPAPKLDSQFTDLFGAPIQKSSDSDKHKAKSLKPSKESKDNKDKKDLSEKTSVKSEKDSHSKHSSRKEESKKHDKPSSSSSKEKEKDSFGSSSKDKDLKNSKDKAERSGHSSDKSSSKNKKTNKDDSKEKSSSSKEKKHDSSSSIKVKEEKKEKERPSSETKGHEDHKKSSKSEKIDRPSSSMDKYKSDKIKKEKVEEKPKDSEKVEKVKKEIKEEKKTKLDHKVKEKSRSNESLLQRSSSRDSDISKHSESKHESKRDRSRTPEPKKEKKREERKESSDKHKKSEIKDSHREEKSSSRKEKEKSSKTEKKEPETREEKVKTTPKKSPKKDLAPMKKKAMEKLESLFSTGENSDDDPFDDDKRRSSSSSDDSEDEKSNASSFTNLKIKDKPLSKLIKQAPESDSDPESPQSPPPEDTKPFVIGHSPLKREDTRSFSPSKSSEHSRKTSTSSELDRKFSESSPKKRQGSLVKSPSPVKRPRLESEPDDVPTDPRLKRRDSVRKLSLGSDSEKEKEIKADLQVSDSSSSSSSDSENSDDDKDEDRADGAENNNIKQTNSPVEFTEEYLIELVKIQQKLMASRDRDLVQKVVDLVGETDCFDVDVAFNFDLCSLDKGTVYRIKDLLQCAT